MSLHKEVWDGAVSLRHEGIDMRAVTAWSLLGAYDWNSLVTRAEGYYELGVFDLRGPHPRPTAIARMISDLYQVAFKGITLSFSYLGALCASVVC
ncbi:hypothetical protein [Allocoleopsis sp.]|uniref:hypothetical protein n=1 Tax=Allocoleopsis sp. TaxID=3088169 RepID=UPI002FD5C85D